VYSFTLMSVEDSLGRRAAAALAAGALSGAATGIIDGLWSWREMARFVPDALGRARALLFLATSYALFAALIACALTLFAIAIGRGTRLGSMMAALSAAHRRARERDPRDALVGLSLVLGGIPALALALGAGYWLAWTMLSGRKHIGLMLAGAMGIAIAALLVAALLTLVLGRLIEIGLRARPGWAGALSSPRAPVIAGLALVAVAGAAAVIKTWDTLSLLPLRPLWIALVALALYPPCQSIGRRLIGRISGLRPLARRGALAVGLVALALLALIAGAAEAPREAAAAHSGAGPAACAASATSTATASAACSAAATATTATRPSTRAPPRSRTTGSTTTASAATRRPGRSRRPRSPRSRRRCRPT
jgi:hypothetical protein